MVHISNNGFVRLTRGDSMSFPLFINRGTISSPVRYNIADHPEAAVYFGVMEPNQPFEKALIRKKYNSESPITKEGDLVIILRPEDTLNVLPGKYYYSVKVDFGDDTVETIIPSTEFWIMD